MARKKAAAPSGKSTSMDASTPLAAWALDYQTKAVYVCLTDTRSKPDAADVLIGFADTQGSKDKAPVSRVQDTSSIQVAKAWEAAMAPSKSLPMNFMMMWMSGSSVQIFSMMVVMMMITNPLKGMASMSSVFAPYRSPKHSLVPQMAVFILCHLASVALGVYKCWSMGLLPTEASDWLAWHQAAVPLERTPTLV